MQPSRHARLVCSAERPYWNMHVNEAWTALMGHSLEEAKLFPFSLMNVSAWAALVSPVIPDISCRVWTCVSDEPTASARAAIL